MTTKQSKTESFKKNTLILHMSITGKDCKKIKNKI